MRRFTSIAAVLTVLLMMLPMLACAATPSMTGMEQDCCQQMHGRCGEMAKQGCCQLEVRNDLKQLPAHVVSAPVVTLVAVAIPYPLPLDLSATAAGYRWTIPEEHSPPGLIVATTTVLRI